MGSQRVGHDWATNAFPFTAVCRRENRFRPTLLTVACVPTILVTSSSGALKWSWFIPDPQGFCTKRLLIWATTVCTCECLNLNADVCVCPWQWTTFCMSLSLYLVTRSKTINILWLYKHSTKLCSKVGGFMNSATGNEVGLAQLQLVFGEGNGTPLQYSCLENPMDGGAWWATVHGVAKSQTRLSDFTFTFHFHALEKEVATHSSVLAWRIPGTGNLVGCHLWGRTESDTTEAT